MLGVKKIKSEPAVGLPTALAIEVFDGDRLVMRDRMKVIRLDEKCLKKISIPGFQAGQMQELILKNTAEWKHLGLTYKVKAEAEKLKW